MKSWRLVDALKNDKFQYTYFAHKINSFDTAPKKLLASDSRLRPDRYALEQGDLSKAGVILKDPHTEDLNQEVEVSKDLRFELQVSKDIWELESSSLVPSPSI
ncbi:hypothetical protein F3Y22_tig00112256pilonHSYRG00001 [Hibiscus syriacus]|uniref:Uncharacterized protein n=1 Tax=Hibiscus syriacus TaxID=106335 RepID=A0A6A2X320_HIBSY|nr:hypothetical protein F3Y22_tig00112256pilonHSYRG00001 [Hibiscus syriacus]